MTVLPTLPIMGTKPLYNRSVIGAKIQGLRKACGWSQADLGASIGRQQSRVAKWELGQGKPEPHDLLRIAQALKVDLRYLCDDTQAEPSKEEHGIFAATADSDEDTRLLVSLVKRFGAREIVNRFFGQPDQSENDEPPGPAKLIAARKRPTPAE